MKSINFKTFLFFIFLLACYTGSTVASCVSPANPIEAENCKPGNPASEWDVSNVGDLSIQGFSTDMSVNRGDTVSFKISTDAAVYQLDIYRMGYYGGMGARKVATITPSAALPQIQPNCLIDPTTLLTDCGNWAVSASWAVPLNTTSGIYFARVVRNDTSGASHIIFVVRDDGSTSDLLFQTSDTTWQAYNTYGGSSLYGITNISEASSQLNRSYKVSYNRPVLSRLKSEDYLFNAEYPMVRWLEANGYHVSYFSGVDSDRRGSLILNHKVFLSVGHDEYWSGAQRTNVEVARNAGIHLAFFSGNEIFWKTRWENSIDGATTPYRTLVCYKDTLNNSPVDPLYPTVWTGTWRDPSFSPPADGGRPENGLSGTIFMVNGPTYAALKVPYDDGKMRFWRNTSIANLAPGGVATLPFGTLGAEWDEDIDNGFRPAGLLHLSTTTVNNAPVLLDYGSNYASGTSTHNLTLYRYSSGALVFGAGTYGWPWGLDGNHDGGATVPDASMQQATVNLLADMGVQPSTLNSGLTTATISTDTAAPTSTITSPAGGNNFPEGNSLTISGTATDTGGGVVGGIEISVDGGTTWHPANGRSTWNYIWVTSQLPGTSVTILSRAIDDSGNIEIPSAGVNITVTSPTCPCSALASGTPSTAASADSASVELGVKFKTDVTGFITGLRFYKGSGNTGTHQGTLWSISGQQLASATFTNETATGWQQVNFASPVPVAANTIYVASYHAPNGNYAINQSYFTNAGIDTPPLHLLQNGVSGGNGVYTYSGSVPVFPTSSYQSSNYWVDVAFTSTPPSGTTPPTVTATSPATGASGISPGANVTVTFSQAIDATTLTTSTFGVQGLSGATVTYNSTTYTATLTPGSPLAASTAYNVTVKGGAAGVKDLAGNALTGDFTWSFTTGNALTYTGWNSSVTPTVASNPDSSSVELGVKFKTDVNGFITGLRFYKGSGNTGTHQGTLWSISGQQLASATFTNETVAGWQQVNFASPVPVAANTTYVASYHAPKGHYAINGSYFATAGIDNPPLHLLQEGVSGGNGVYTYSSSVPVFPTSSYQSSNYWVDVAFTSTPPSGTTPPTVTATSPATGASGISPGATVTVTFSQAIDATTLTTSTFGVQGLSGATVTYNSTTYTATLTPGSPLAASTAYNVTVKGGAAGVKDLAGNALTADFTWSFTTGNAVTYTGWNSSVTPAVTSNPDSSSVELGVKFKTDVTGFITGLRFYKGSGNTGTHQGTLWSISGQQLASATFTNETVAGWQQVNFASPVRVAANTTYVASYNAPKGRYAINRSYFATAGIDNPPLHLLRDGVSGGNGVYSYSGSVPVFPTSSYQSSNYWVDVVFSH
jgi:hypothetical protein